MQEGARSTREYANNKIEKNGSIERRGTRKIKTGELAAGTDDKVQLVTYAIGLTRIPDEVN
jgi:hypothetical protein